MQLKQKAKKREIRKRENESSVSQEISKWVSGKEDAEDRERREVQAGWQKDGNARLNRVRATGRMERVQGGQIQLAADREQEAQVGKKQANLTEGERGEKREREREKERGDRFACSAACPACPCAVGGMLHVELTARIYILLARIFISVRGRLTSSMTGGRDAWCLAWLCLTAFLRTSLRRATARGDAKAKGTRRLTMLSHHSGTARRFDPTRRHEFPSASPTCLSLLAPRHVSGGSASRSLLHFPLSCDRDAENCDRD